MEVRASARPLSDGRWVATTSSPPRVQVEGESRDACLAALRRAIESERIDRRDQEPLVIVVEAPSLVAGVAEAAEVMGWDKRRVITYIDRGRFPEPVQALASGRVWLREDLERFARAWHGARNARSEARADPGRGSG